MNTIPLHRLPSKAFLRVLQRMGVSDQLAYSLCSKNTKKAIKSLNLKAQLIKFKVFDYIDVEFRLGKSVQFFTSIKHDKAFPSNQIISREDITVSVFDPTQIDWKRNFENFELKEWIHHFCKVLHHPKIDNLFFYNENINVDYIEPIQKVIKGLQIGRLGLLHDLTNDFAKKALESFLNYEKLYIAQVPYGGHKMNKVLIQNLKSLYIQDGEVIKINEVLLLNSEQIEIIGSLLTEKDLNRFLKLWIRGSNLRLKYFDISGEPQLDRDSFDENDILKGIKYNQIPLDSDEMYRNYIDAINFTEMKLAGGFRVWRFDGTTAVILVTWSRFKFIVE